jgi:hypothetical protein
MVPRVNRRFNESQDATRLNTSSFTRHFYQHLMSRFWACKFTKLKCFFSVHFLKKQESCVFYLHLRVTLMRFLVGHMWPAGRALFRTGMEGTEYKWNVYQTHCNEWSWGLTCWWNRSWSLDHLRPISKLVNLTSVVNLTNILLRQFPYKMYNPKV